MKNKKLQKNIVNLGVFISGLIILIPTVALGQSATNQIVRCNGTSIPCGFPELMSTLYRLLLVVISIGIAAIAIVMSYAGFTYLTAAGDSGKISKAHKMFTTAIWGFLIMISAYLIVELLFSVFGVNPNFSRGVFSR